MFGAAYGGVSDIRGTLLGVLIIRESYYEGGSILGSLVLVNPPYWQAHVVWGDLSS